MAGRISLTSHPLAWAAAASAASLGLLVVRLGIRWDTELVFLTWNLLLAWVPLALAVAIARGARGGAPRLALLVATAGWLLFLPNAPYLVTDLIHLRGRADGIPALDLATLAAFAATGLLIFVVAVLMVEQAARLRLGDRAVRGLVPACIWLSSIGIYLGRVLRWNSWDVLGAPVGRAESLLRHLGDPVALAVAVLFTVGVAVGLHLVFAAAGRFTGRAAQQ